MLPDIYQQVFLLRDVKELNTNDTAQILEISTSLVKVRLHRARMRLQRLLAPKLTMIDGPSKKGCSINRNINLLARRRNLGAAKDLGQSQCPGQIMVEAAGVELSRMLKNPQVVDLRTAKRQKPERQIDCTNVVQKCSKLRCCRIHTLAGGA